MQKQVDVAIIGAGMTGLAAAIALAQQSLRVAVIEKTDLASQHRAGFDGRVSAISLGSQIILENLGAWEAMHPKAQPIHDIVVQEAGGFGAIHFDHQAAGEEPMGHILENRHIRIALLERARKLESLDIFDGQQIDSIAYQDEFVEIEIGSGQRLSASLLLAADGKFSQWRDWAGIAVTERDYGQTAMVATIAHSEPHHGLALERFFPDGPFAVLPMQDQRASLVWVEPTALAQAILRLPEAEWMAYLNDKMQGYLGELSLEGKVWSYPLMAKIAQEYTAPRFMLIGDAAHGIHPIAGQGVNLGFRDVAVLAEVVAKARALGQDIGKSSVLEPYSQWRRFDVTSMFAATDGINQLFSNANPAMKLARNVGFYGVNQMTGLRDRFMKAAMGREGDLPTLAKRAA